MCVVTRHTPLLDSALALVPALAPVLAWLLAPTLEPAPALAPTPVLALARALVPALTHEVAWLLDGGAGAADSETSLKPVVGHVRTKLQRLDDGIAALELRQRVERRDAKIGRLERERGDALLIKHSRHKIEPCLILRAFLS